MKKLLPLLIISAFLLSCSKDKKSDEAADKMQDFIINISNYARAIDPSFIIIPQNGPELVYKQVDPGEGFKPDYMSAIDGLGIEELFYNGSLATDQERLNILLHIPPEKKVMVAEYVSDDSALADAIRKNSDEGFVSFVRTKDNYDYHRIPDTLINENANDINTLSDIQNYLYLINPDEFASRQAYLDALASTNYDLLLIDLFYQDNALEKSEIEQLRTKANGAKRLVIAYMNIGSAENYRYYWKSEWKLHHPDWLKKPYEGYSDEIWVEFWNDEWKNIIYGNNDSYTKKILDAGFDGAYLDNIEAYYFLYFE